MYSQYSRSRLRRRLDREARNQIILFALGIMVLVYLLIRFGFGIVTFIPDLFIRINQMTASSSRPATIEEQIVLPPVLNPFPSATNSALFTFSGKTPEANNQILLFLNGSQRAAAQTDKNGTFTFKGIQLQTGSNSVKVRSKSPSGKLSDFSDEFTITYIKKAPDLTVSFPQDNAQFSKYDKELTVKGKTNPDDRVTVNGFWAITDSQGNFSYTLTLEDGDNTIQIIAQDGAGNQTEKQIKVSYHS